MFVFAGGGSELEAVLAMAGFGGGEQVVREEAAIEGSVGAPVVFGCSAFLLRRRAGQGVAVDAGAE